MHCGDVCGEEVFAELAAVRADFVWGNCDDIDPLAQAFVRDLGLTLPRSVPLTLSLEGKHIAVFHGHEPEFAIAAAYAGRNLDLKALKQQMDSIHAARDSGLSAEELGVAAQTPRGWARFDYILCGHTHIAADYQRGATRIINPGALHRASVHTVATLDLKTDDLRFWLVRDEDDGFSEPVPFLVHQQD